MSIWFRPYTLDQSAPLRGGTWRKHLGIEFTELGDDFLRGRMPVDDRTHQPFGILHGGASVALAETLGSTGAGLVVDHGQVSRASARRSTRTTCAPSRAAS